MRQGKLRGAMIGAGYFAGIQAEAWRRMESAEVVAVADPVPGKALAFAERWGIRHAHESASEMLSRHDLDFVDIATRPEPHGELVDLAARRGLHAICQKPLAPTWEQCARMVEACEGAGVRLLVHENWRWQPWYRQAKRLIDEGRVGRPFQLTFQWRTGDGTGPKPYVVQPYFREMPRLLVYEALVHLLDTFRYLAGEIRGLYCQVRRVSPVIRGEDQAVIVATFEGGALGLVDSNRIAGPAAVRPAAGTLLVEGDGGTVRMDAEGRLWTAELGKDEAPHEYPIPLEGYRGDSVRATQEHLIECLRAGRPAESEGREYLKTVKAVFACYASAATGREVLLEGFEP
ncbi:MAG: Gfo/Idh/MocA family oxidoreductase [Planctomycetes bacterium]|nr:Gfo/Idh/MocA family oxidoreductase [Planctomycetota bacterium]